MSFEAWAAFAAASTILLVIPGPTVLLVVSFALFLIWHLLRFHRRVLRRRTWNGSERRSA